MILNFFKNKILYYLFQNMTNKSFFENRRKILKLKLFIKFERYLKNIYC